MISRASSWKALAISYSPLMWLAMASRFSKQAKSVLGWHRQPFLLASMPLSRQRMASSFLFSFIQASEIPRQMALARLQYSTIISSCWCQEQMSAICLYSQASCMLSWLSSQQLTTQLISSTHSSYMNIWQYPLAMVFFLLTNYSSWGFILNLYDSMLLRSSRVYGLLAGRVDKMFARDGGFSFSIDIMMPMNGYLRACFYAARCSTQIGMNWSRKRLFSRVSPSEQMSACCGSQLQYSEQSSFLPTSYRQLGMQQGTPAKLMPTFLANRLVFMPLPNPPSTNPFLSTEQYILCGRISRWHMRLRCRSDTPLINWKHRASNCFSVQAACVILRQVMSSWRVALQKSPTMTRHLSLTSLSTPDSMTQASWQLNPQRLFSSRRFECSIHSSYNPFLNFQSSYRLKGMVFSTCYNCLPWIFMVYTCLPMQLGSSMGLAIFILEPFSCMKVPESVYIFKLWLMTSDALLVKWVWSTNSVFQPLFLQNMSPKSGIFDYWKQKSQDPYLLLLSELRNMEDSRDRLMRASVVPPFQQLSNIPIVIQLQLIISDILYSQQIQKSMLREKNKDPPSTPKQNNNKQKPDSSPVPKPTSQAQQQVEPSMLQYTLQKLLAQSAEREERYINFIKEQKEQLFTVTERYATVMGRYEKEIKEFITKKQSQKQAKLYERVHRMASKQPPNQYNKKEYTLDSEYELQCKITFKFIIPILEDYLKQSFPPKFRLEFMQYYPSREHRAFAMQLNPQLDAQELIDNIRNGYSIDLCGPDLAYPAYTFVISHFCSRGAGGGPKVLKYYKNSQIQFLMRDQSTDLLFGYGKIDLQQLLQFNPDSQDSWVEKIPVVSLTIPDKVVAYLYVEQANQAAPRKISHEHIHKVSQPIALSRQQLRVYNDKESRLIQRINQYKNLHTNIIPGPSSQSADKNILMHQKRKELEQIEQYKEMTKGEYMEKVFGEAIEQYHTEPIEVGECKYVHFVYSNHTDRHQKAKIGLTYRPVKDTGDQAKEKEIKMLSSKVGSNHEEANETISVEMVDPNTVMALIQQQILSYPTKIENSNFEFTLDNGYVFVVMGEAILVYVKVICHTLAPMRYQLNFQLANDFGQVLHNDMIILRTMEPISTHVFPLYTYVGEVNELKVQVPSYQAVKEGFSLVGKAKIANILGGEPFFHFENVWTQNYQILELKIISTAKITPNKTYTCYLLLYDMSYVVLLASYQFLIECVQKIQDQNIELGRTQSFIFKLKFPPQDNAAGQKMMVRLGSSDYLGGCCAVYSGVNKAKQFVADPNVEYPITLDYNTFLESPHVEKLIVTCLNTTTSKCLKKLALNLRKIPCQVKQIYRLLCPGNNKPLAHTLELHCGHKQQTTYKLYSSNSSLLQVVEPTLVMFTGQTKSVGLEFRYWQNENSTKFSSTPGKRAVLLAVDDGRFCALYLYELQCEE